MEMIQKIDEVCLLFIQENLRVTCLNPFWKMITMLGNAGWFWITLSMVLLFWKKTRKVGMLSITAMVLGFVITNLLLKNLIARPRPYQQMIDLVLLIEKPVDFSFPSGHTCASFASAFILYQMLPKRYGRAAIILAGLIAFSRLYLGAHYPTDVLAGFLIAWGVSRFVLYVLERSQKVQSR